MDEKKGFDKSVSELGISERNELLEKIAKTVLQRPRVSEYAETAVPKIDPVHEYNKLPQLLKLFYIVKAVFSVKTKYELIEERFLRKVKKRIQQKFRGLMDFRMKQFSPLMRNALEDLTGSASVFLKPVHHAVIEKRQEFSRYLLGKRFTGIDDRLAAELDPFAIAEEISAKTERDVKDEMDHRFEMIFSSVNKEEVNEINMDLYSLEIFSRLTCRSLPRILEIYDDSLTGREGYCHFKDLEGMLEPLGAFLFAENVVHTPLILDTVLEFYLQNREDGADGLQLNTKLREYITSLQDFYRSVPVLDVLKIIHEDVNYIPALNRLEENWFNTYKSDWLDKMDTMYNDFFLSRKKRAVLDEGYEILALEQAEKLQYFVSNFHFTDLPVRWEYSIEFLRNFFTGVFQIRMYRPLEILFLHGDFYKAVNRTEFTDCYTGVSNLGFEIERLEHLLSPEGEAGKAITGILGKPLQPEEKRMQIKKVISGAEETAQAVVEHSIAYISQLGNVLYGVLNGKSGERYDTILNKKEIGGIENKELQHQWGEVLEYLKAAGRILAELSGLEQQ